MCVGVRFTIFMQSNPQWEVPVGNRSVDGAKIIGHSQIIKLLPAVFQSLVPHLGLQYQCVVEGATLQRLADEKKKIIVMNAIKSVQRGRQTDEEEEDFYIEVLTQKKVSEVAERQKLENNQNFFIF